jgi:hypothetical protein
MADIPKKSRTAEVSASNASDTQWDAAIRNIALPNTPSDMLVMAQSVRQTLQAEMDSVTPTDSDVDRAWQKVLTQVKAGGVIAPQSNWWQRLIAWLPKPQILAPALVFVLVAGVAINTLLDKSSTDMEITGVRGINTIFVVDIDAAEPQIVAELRALALNPNVIKQTNGLLVELAWPSKPTQAQLKWLAKNGLLPPTQANLKFLLLKRVP